MKKIIMLIFFTMLSSNVLAEHYFNLCYYNWSNSVVHYNNDGIKHKWKHSEALMEHNNGVGTIQPNAHVCFNGFSDETMFVTHYITFYLEKKWIGIVNPGFSRPYAIKEGASNTKGGRLMESIIAGKDNYMLYIHIKEDGSVMLSGSSDPKDISKSIVARKFS